MVVVVVVAVVVGEGLGRSWGKKGGGGSLLAGRAGACCSVALLVIKGQRTCLVACSRGFSSGLVQWWDW